MRKKLIYAMMALGLMASCSKDTYVDSSGSTPDGEEQPMQIQISANPRLLTIASRGTGVVGGTDDNTNKWRQQPLFIFAFPKNVTTGVTTKMLKEHSILFNEEAIAPNNAVDDFITWKAAGVVYFPRNGAYDFFGYHVDDANTATADPSMEELADGISTGVPDTLWSIPIVIDGSQDLMIAKATLTPVDSLTLAKIVKGDAYTKPVDGYSTDADYEKMKLEWNKAFSSYTARKVIQPAMGFKHLLSRLIFNVEGNGTKAGANEVFVTSIKIRSKTTGKLVFACKAEKNGGIKWATEPVEANLSIKEAPVTVGDPLVALNNGLADVETTIKDYATKNDLEAAMGTGGALEGKTLDEILGKYYSPFETDHYTEKQVGESLMLEPGVDKYIAEVEVMQYYDGKGNKIVVPTEAEDYGTDKDKRYYKYTIDINAKDVTKKGENGAPTNAGITTFAPSNSYNITILVNGYKDIEIKASLGLWIDGGDIKLNPDDDDFQN